MGNSSSSSSFSTIPRGSSARGGNKEYDLAKCNPLNLTQLSCFVVGSFDHYDLVSSLWFRHSAFPSPCELRDAVPVELHPDEKSGTHLAHLHEYLNKHPSSDVQPMTQLVVISPPTLPFHHHDLYTKNNTFILPHLFTDRFDPMTPNPYGTAPLSAQAHDEVVREIKKSQRQPQRVETPTHESTHRLPPTKPSSFLYSSPDSVMINHNGYDLGINYLYEPNYIDTAAKRAARLFQWYPHLNTNYPSLFESGQFERSQQYTVLLHLMPPNHVDEYGAYVNDNTASQICKDICFTPETLLAFPIIVIDLDNLAPTLLRATQFLQDFAHLINSGSPFVPQSVLDNMSLFFLLLGQQIHYDDDSTMLDEEMLQKMCYEMGFKTPPTVFRYGDTINPAAFLKQRPDPTNPQNQQNDTPYDQISMIHEINHFYQTKQLLHNALSQSLLNHFQSFHLALSPYEQFTRYFRTALRCNVKRSEFDSDQGVFQIFTRYNFRDDAEFLHDTKRHQRGSFLPVLPYLPKPVLSLPHCTVPLAHQSGEPQSRMFFQNAIQMLQLPIIPLGFPNSSDGYDTWLTDLATAAYVDPALNTTTQQTQACLPLAFSYTTEIFDRGVNKDQIHTYEGYEAALHDADIRQFVTLMESSKKYQDLTAGQQLQLKKCFVSKSSMPVQYLSQKHIHVSSPVVSDKKYHSFQQGADITSTPTTSDKGDNVVFSPNQLNHYLAHLDEKDAQIYVCRNRSVHFMYLPFAMTSTFHQDFLYQHTCHQTNYNLHGLFRPFHGPDVGLPPLARPVPFLVDTSQYIDRDAANPHAVIVPKAAIKPLEVNTTDGLVPGEITIVDKLYNHRNFKGSARDDFNTYMHNLDLTASPPTQLSSPSQPEDSSTTISISPPLRRYNYTVQLHNIWKLDEELWENMHPQRSAALILLFDLRTKTPDARNAVWNLFQLNNLNVPLHVLFLVPPRTSAPTPSPAPDHLNPPKSHEAQQYSADSAMSPYDSAVDSIRSLMEDVCKIVDVEENSNCKDLSMDKNFSMHVGKGSYFTKGPCAVQTYANQNTTSLQPADGATEAVPCQEPTQEGDYKPGEFVEPKESEFTSTLSDKSDQQFYQPLLKSNRPPADVDTDEYGFSTSRWKVHIIDDAGKQFFECIHRILFHALAQRTLLHEVSFGNIAAQVKANPKSQ